MAITRSNEDFIRLSPEEHMRENADNYINNTSITDCCDILIDFEKSKPNKIKVKQGKFRESCGRKRLYLEALSNATDNVFFTRTVKNVTSKDSFSLKPQDKWEHADVGKIEVTMTESSVTIKNGGLPMPVCVREDESTPTELVTTPKFVCTKVHAGSNNVKAKNTYTCGKNAVGMKAILIYSDFCRIEVCDNINGQKYEGEWSNQKRKEDLDRCTPGFKWDGTKWKSLVTDQNKYRGENSFSITFEPTKYYDWTKFDIGNMEDYAKILLEMSFTCKVPVKFTCTYKDKKYEISNNSFEYDNLFDIFSTVKAENKLFRYVWHDKNTSCTKDILDQHKLSLTEQKKRVMYPIILQDTPLMELYLYDTPDNGKVYSYVNGLNTKLHGIHVETILTAIKDAAGLNSYVGNGSKITKSIIDSTIMKHFTFFILVRLKNAMFDHQTKDKLTRHNPTGKKESKVIEKPTDLISISKWKASIKVHEELISLGTIVKKPVGSKNKNVNCSTLQDANDAGIKGKSKDCVLYLVEGLSASSYPHVRIDNSPGGRSKGGYLPLRGKIKNISKMSSAEELDKIDTVKNILIALGLDKQSSFGIHLDFNDEDTRNCLRYGKVIIVTDADTDGYHILCLILNFFHRMYPTLIEAGIIQYLRTPMIRIFDKKKQKASDIRGKLIDVAYDQNEFNTIMKNHPSWAKEKDVVYFKGLGASTDADVIDDIKRAWVVKFFIDDKASNTFIIAFGKEADKRKQWIAEYSDYNSVVIDRDTMLPIGPYYVRSLTNVVQNELTTYYKDSNYRAIPSYYDGWKESQRQALWYVLNKWEYGHSNAQPEKVEQIANAAAGYTHYAHGATSLMLTIINMAQMFPGYRNMNIFAQVGQFGTRAKNGQDVTPSTARYSRSKAEWWFIYAFNKLMCAIPKKRIVEGHAVEPKFIPSIIPWHLINGVVGVGTGYSSKIPCHCPHEVIEWLMIRCEKDNPNDIGFNLSPCYTGHKGVIHIINTPKEICMVDGKPKYGKFFSREHVPMSEESSDTPDELIDGDKPIVETTEQYDPATDTKPKMISYGLYETMEENDSYFSVVITELPVGTCTHAYKKLYLDVWLSKGYIKEYNDLGSGNEIKLDIKQILKEHVNNTINGLHLSRSMTLDNMNLCDNENNPLHFRNAGEIIESYYIVMINVYEIMRRNLIKDKKEVLDNLKQRRLFAQLFREEKLKLPQGKQQISLDDWYVVTDKLKISRKIVDSFSIKYFTKEYSEELDKKIDTTDNDLVKIEETSEQDWYRKDLVLFRNKVLNNTNFPKRIGKCSW